MLLEADEGCGRRFVEAFVIGTRVTNGRHSARVIIVKVLWREKLPCPANSNASTFSAMPEFEHPE